jgi:hypothetical protein
MPVDFDALRSETGSGVPDDGLHTARLERAAVIETDRGSRLITEWSDENNLMWTSWNRFDASGLKFTQDLLDGLGVNRSQITEDNFSDELAQMEGGTYQVRTDSKQGKQGDRWFTSTYIEQAIAGRQQTLADIPADSAGLPERDAAPAGTDLFADDDVPF